MGRANINHPDDTMTDSQIPTLLCKASVPASFQPLSPPHPSLPQRLFHMFFSSLGLLGEVFCQQSFGQFLHRAVRAAAFQRLAINSRKYLTILTLYFSFLLLLKKEEEKENPHTHTTKRCTVTKTFLLSLTPTRS